LLARGRLLWLPELGLGYLDQPPAPGLYDEDYFKHYVELDASPISAELTAERMLLVLRHHEGEIVDVGVGGGRFVREANCYGWDVNPYAIKLLHDSGRLRDPRSQPVDAVTMWDSIEHMTDPGEILQNVRQWAFISTPIYTSEDDAIASKHFKPGEHLWYFTEAGLLSFMQTQGFRLQEANRMECTWREGIGSYAFRRIEPW
jgi:hypothetical protein